MVPTTYEQQETEVPEQLPLRQFPRLPIILATQPNSCHPNSPQPSPSPQSTNHHWRTKTRFLASGNLQIAILMVRNSCHRPSSAPPKYLPPPPPPSLSSPSSHCFTSEYKPLWDKEIIFLSLKTLWWKCFQNICKFFSGRTPLHALPLQIQYKMHTGSNIQNNVETTLVLFSQLKSKVYLSFISPRI